jgi:hypothetical protein
MKRHVVPTSESLFGLMERRAPSLYPPAQLHSETSRKAARAVEPKTGSQRGIVLAYIRSRGSSGAADFEGIAALKQDNPSMENAYRARRGELVQLGLIRLATGMRRVSPAGLECDVWIQALPGESQ